MHVLKYTTIGLETREIRTTAVRYSGWNYGPDLSYCSAQKHPEIFALPEFQHDVIPKTADLP